MRNLKCKDKGYKEFDHDDIFLDNDSEELTQLNRIVKPKNVVWLDRSNFITDLSFINMAWNPMMVPNPILIHVGSASFTHIPYLSSLYPEFEYHLYDIRDFVMDHSKYPNITVHNNYFDEHEALKWAKRNDVYLINHAHTIKFLGEDADDVRERDKKILDDMKIQEDWVKTVSPIKALLKFRSPDTYNELGQSIDYLHGHTLFLPWVEALRYETRLIVDKNHLDNIIWDLVKYKKQMMWHDIIVRQQYKYYNPLGNDCDISEVDPPELIDDYDSTLEIMIWKDYLSKRKGVCQVKQEEVVGLSRNLTKILNENSDKKTSLNILRNGK